jgi:hypothetical protein
MRSIFTGAKKCAGAKHHKGACADWCFAEAEPPIGGEAHTILLCAVGAYTIIIFIHYHYYKFFKIEIPIL